MPMYDYTCAKCGASTERVVKLDDRDTQTCDAVKRSREGQPCGGELVRDEISVNACMGHNWGDWQ